jgi:3-hydroxy acid dehydrogenase/malonic semialdehyde reductase
MAQTVFITGATSGIGEATARLLAQNKFRLILCGRRKERLDLLKEQLGSLTEVHTLNFDVREKIEVANSITSLPSNWKDIDILINNAGNAHGYDLIHEGHLEDWEAMIDINIKGLLYVSKMIIPGMVERQTGHIINIGSIAGKEVYPKGNVYCASKYAVDAISTGMRLDLNNFGIKVSEINPGMVETEFAMVRFKGDKEKAKNTYQGLKPLTGDDIAEIILFIITRPAHVNISDVIVFPSAQASATTINRKKE